MGFVQVVNRVLSREHMSQSSKLTCSQLSGFIAQLVEHCSGIAEVMSANPAEDM